MATKGKKKELPAFMKAKMGKEKPKKEMVDKKKKSAKKC